MNLENMTQNQLKELKSVKQKEASNCLLGAQDIDCADLYLEAYKIIEEANSINIGLTMFEHFKIKTNISTDRELYQQIFINYLCENIKDLNLISKNVSIDIQKHINTKKKNPD